MTAEPDSIATVCADDVQEGLKALAVVLRTWVVHLERDVKTVSAYVDEFQSERRLPQLGAIAVAVESLAERSKELAATIRFIAREAEQ